MPAPRRCLAPVSAPTRPVSATGHGVRASSVEPRCSAAQRTEVPRKMARADAAHMSRRFVGVSRTARLHRRACSRNEASSGKWSSRIAR
jgi:hypothetical protein